MNEKATEKMYKKIMSEKMVQKIIDKTIKTVGLIENVVGIMDEKNNKKGSKGFWIPICKSSKKKSNMILN